MLSMASIHVHILNISIKRYNKQQNEQLHTHGTNKALT